MKKLIILMSLITVSCNKEDIQPEPEPVVDCECDRVVNVTTFNLPDGTVFGNYSTVNDCTNFQQNHSYTGASNMPTEGNCK
jgi:hypothetical protein